MKEVNIYCRKEKRPEGDKMILFHEPVKEIQDSLADSIQANKKAEHHREFE